MQSPVLYQVEDWKKPALIVFDLDFTLWPFRVDKSAKSPFRVSKKGNVTDAKGRVFKTFPEVPQLLMTLTNNGYSLAVASRIEDIPGAYQLLQLFGITQYFQYKEIYPNTKTVHFHQLHAKTGMKFDHMVFFDDDKRNVRDVSRLGVMAIQVPQGGMTFSVLNTGLLSFASTFMS
jgi:magnesium-dependent phosphatase 1